MDRTRRTRSSRAVPSQPRRTLHRSRRSIRPTRRYQRRHRRIYHDHRNPRCPRSRSDRRHSPLDHPPIKGLGFEMVIVCGLDGSTPNHDHELALGPDKRTPEWGLLLPPKVIAERDPTCRTTSNPCQAEARTSELCGAYSRLTRAKRALYVLSDTLQPKTTSTTLADTFNSLSRKSGPAETPHGSKLKSLRTAAPKRAQQNPTQQNKAAIQILQLSPLSTPKNEPRPMRSAEEPTNQPTNQPTRVLHESSKSQPIPFIRAAQPRITESPFQSAPRSSQGFGTRRKRASRCHTSSSPRTYSLLPAPSVK